MEVVYQLDAEKPSAGKPVRAVFARPANMPVVNGSVLMPAQTTNSSQCGKHLAYLTVSFNLIVVHVQCIDYRHRPA